MRAAAVLFAACALAGYARGEDLLVPFESGPGGLRILLKAQVFDRPAILILDTGSAQTMLRPDLVRVPTEPIPASRFSGNAPGVLVHGQWSVATIRIGGETWRLRPVVAARFDGISQAMGTPIDGILGQDFLREFRTVTIDFKAKTLRLGP